MDKELRDALDSGKVIVMGNNGIAELKRYALIVEDENGAICTRLEHTSLGNIIRALVVLSRASNLPDSDLVGCLMHVIDTEK